MDAKMVPDSRNEPRNDDVLMMLREQAVLYAQLESLAKRQRPLVSDDDIGPLLTVLAARQRVSEKLVHLGTKLAPIRGEWPQRRERLSPQQRDEADRCLRDAGEALKRVLDRDAEDARVLSGRKHVVSAALGRAQSTQQAMSAYRTPGAAPARLDCTDEGAR